MTQLSRAMLSPEHPQTVFAVGSDMPTVVVWVPVHQPTQRMGTGPWPDDIDMASVEWKPAAEGDVLIRWNRKAQQVRAVLTDRGSYAHVTVLL